MLRELYIRDLGVIREASVAFGEGLNVVTGETGVGKTLLVSSLGLLRGGRASARLVSQGADEARVEAVIDVPETVRTRLAELDIETDDELVVSRKVSADGRSRAWVGGRLVPVSVLAELGLIELCGQGAGSELARPAAQLSAIDALASNGTLLRSFRSARERREDLAEQDARLRATAESTAREAELLAFQAAEIERAELYAGEDEDLETEISRLEHAEQLGEVALQALSLIGPEGAAGASTEAQKLLASNVRFDPGIEPLVARLADVAVEAADLARELRAWAEGLEADPGRLSHLRERRALIASLKRKHGATVEEILAVAENARRRLTDLEGSDGRLEAISTALREADEEMNQIANELSSRRKDAAQRMSELVAGELPSLALPRASFEVRCERTGELGADGGDVVTFMFSADRRRRIEPLGKVASGGELSRAMIATTLALAGSGQVLVFDEADQGVGGEAALDLARRLSRLGTSNQVLVVSHLPQIAAFADQHVVVDKDGAGVRIEVVTAADRVSEVSRMLAGLESSERARAHATELLDLAAEERATTSRV